jgi:hypothetical protein
MNKQCRGFTSKDALCSRNTINGVFCNIHNKTMINPNSISNFIQLVIENTREQYSKILINRIMIATSNMNCTIQDFLDIIDTIIEPINTQFLRDISINNLVYKIDEVNLIYCRHRQTQLGWFDETNNKIIWN